MRGNGPIGGDDLGNILVAVMREVTDGIVAIPYKRTRRDGFGRIPTKRKVYRVVCHSVEPLDAKITIVHEAVVGVGDRVYHFNVFHAATHAVEGHCDDHIAVLPTDWTIFAVVGDGPGSSHGAHKRLIAVGVKLRQEFFPQRRRVAEIGDLGVLVEGIRHIGAVGAEIKG